VAIKLLSPSLERHLSARQRFLREAEIVAALHHAHIVRTFRMERDRSKAWLVMELVEGQTLDGWMHRHGPMPPRMAVETLLQVCAGVGAAHDAGVIHRDIKPGNVLVDPSGCCKVADFGLARGLDSVRLTRTGTSMGTYGYMAPEQQNDAQSTGPSADIFSLGATLLALLTGRAPKGVALGLAQLEPSIPLVLSRVLVRATLDEPAHRHGSVAGLTQALTRCLDQTQAVPPDTPALHMPLDGAAFPRPSDSTLWFPTAVDDD
jgi:serine/threonine-protein kinase